MMRSFSVTSLLPAVVAAGLAIASSAFSPANAYSVIPSNQTAGSPAGPLFDVNINAGDVGRTLDPFHWLVPANTQGSAGTLPVDLIAEATMKVLGMKTDTNTNTTALDLSMTITNKTAASLQAAIVSFGFGLNPNAQSVKEDSGVTASVFKNIQIQNNPQNFPGGFKNIDFCASSGGNCSGGDINSGLQSGGKSDTLAFTLTTDKIDPVKGVTLSGFGLKFQTAVGSFEPDGVPEPLTVVGSGLALGFGALFKREVAKKRNKAVVKSLKM